VCVDEAQRALDAEHRHEPEHEQQRSPPQTIPADA
jgi:hypothetical protein